MPDKNEALPTQKLIEVEAIKNGTLILKGGRLRQILLVSGTNFDLKSEEEQSMIIGQFQSFLNSLNFAVQIFIHSRKINIEKYLDNLSVRETQEDNELLKNQIVEYREFIKAFVAENAIMNKSFFLTIPYDAIQLSEGSGAVTEKIFGFLKKKGVAKPTERIAVENRDQERQLEEHINQLNRRASQVIAGLNQLDLRAIQLNDEELTELFYNLYNPGDIEKSLTAQPEAIETSNIHRLPGEKKDLPTALKSTKTDSQDKL